MLLNLYRTNGGDYFYCPADRQSYFIQGTAVGWATGFQRDMGGGSKKIPPELTDRQYARFKQALDRTSFSTFENLLRELKPQIPKKK